MSYEPTNWKTGDIVTAQKLNKIEQGIAGSSTGGGVFYVDAELTMDDSGPIAGTPNHTFAETLEAYQAGKTVMIRFTYNSSVCVCPLILTQEINGVQGIDVMVFLMYLEVFWAVGFVFDGTIAFNRIGA